MGAWDRDNSLRRTWRRTALVSKFAPALQKYAQKITLVMAASLLLTDSYIVADRKSVTNNQMNLKFDYLNTALRTRAFDSSSHCRLVYMLV